jgi:hypothetical protein
MVILMWLILLNMNLLGGGSYKRLLPPFLPISMRMGGGFIILLGGSMLNQLGPLLELLQKGLLGEKTSRIL